MRVLVTGADGMLGTALVPVLLANNYAVLPTDITALSSKTKYLDINNATQLQDYINNFSPQIIFHLAAETNVDKCQTCPEHAYKINTTGTENIAKACLKNDIAMVYISTGSVFDGRKKDPYTEYDKPNPINIYAQSKLNGEKIVQKLLNRHYIVRAGWMIGGVEKDKKFVAKIFEQCLNKKEISVVTDKRGSPTFTTDLSQGITELVSSQKYGLYHLTNEGNCTRFEIAQKIVGFIGKEKEVIVRPITSDAFPLPAPRPDSEALDNFKLKSLGICKMPKWEDTLKAYVDVLMKKRR